MNYQWKLPKNKINKQAKLLARQFKLPTSLAQLLINRGYQTKADVQHFLNPKLTDLGSPFRINGLESAIAVIEDTIKKHQKITIYGDYDVDGITSTSITYLLLKHFGADVHPFIELD